ncbi:MAG: PIN domain-containing protein [Nitrososphaera sp.]|nr:PIN domain-containing protein [Nitrososphaera sp.]
MRFLDTNIILRYLTRDDPKKAEACFVLFQKVKKGQEILTTSETVIAEVVYVLSSPTIYNLSPQEIRARLLPIILLRGLKLPHKHLYSRALELYAAYPTLDFEDVLSLAHMERQKIRDIYSYDHHFNRISSIKRLEPSLDSVRPPFS